MKSNRYTSTGVAKPRTSAECGTVASSFPFRVSEAKPQAATMAVAFCGAIMLISAAPDQRAHDLVRQGNASFRDKDFPAALKYYADAEQRITDPGLTAYNKAVTFYRLKRYGEAEQHFQRSLEDANGPRRLHSLYGLGNALVQQASDTDVTLLETAVTSYRLCRQHTGLSETMRAKINHNLELARLLLIKARAKQAEQTPPDTKNDGHAKQKPPGSPDQTQNGNGDPNGTNPDTPGPNDNPNGQSKTPPSDKPIPGKGRLQTLPDDAELRPLDDETSRRLLQQAMQRIQQQRRQNREADAPPARGVKDW